jgi:tetratricopeptide (TPR) repeat protein
MSWLEKALARYSIATYRVWLEEHPPPATPIMVTAASSPDMGHRDGDSEEVDGSDGEEAVGVAIGNTIVDESTVASAFRNFHSFVAGITQETQSAISGRTPKNWTPEKEAEKREVYKYYFKFLSLLLLPPSHPERPVTKHLVPGQNGGKETISMVASAGPRKTIASKAGTPKQLREELREISAVYQKLLLASLKFPRADEYCEPVGEWIDQVVENWRTAGGSAEDAAPVVEILYKAAQNTFHSPRVLRHLFYTLYATGNFVDALAALNTYVELVEKAKERLAKGSEEKDFDSDKLIIQTVVEGVRVLCKFTGNPQKAMELAEKMEKWIEEWRIKERETLAEAYRGIGMANAAYARQTPEAELRPDAQKAAAEAFKKALTYGPIDAQSWYGFALMSAEMRKVDEAMESTRRGLGALKYNFVDNEDPDDAEGNARDYKRYAVPLLHLLALLMTAREDFENAEKVCKNAFDIVGEGREAVEDLGVNDKVAIFELMMTQLAIVEAVEDSEAAIPMADHLLGLYSMLFDSTYLVQRLEAGNSDDTPMGSNPSSRPTTASRRSRFFNRGHKKQFSASYTSLPPQAAGQESPPSRGASIKKQRPKSGHQALGMGLPDQAGSTPRIHVTDVNGGATTPEKVPRKMRPVSISGGTIRRMRSLGSMRLKQRQDEPPTPPLPASTEASSLEFSPSSSVREIGKNPHLFHTLKTKLHHHQLHNGHNGESASDTSILLEKFPADMGVEFGRESIKTEDIPHNLPRNKLPHPLGALGRTMSDDGQSGRTTSVRRPLQLPEPKLAVDEERRQVLGALRGAWICVAGLYGRAGYFEDAHMATDEANSLIQKDGDGEADVLAAVSLIPINTQLNPMAK